MRPIKILIIEDNEIIARDMTNFLTDWHYNVIGCAATGEQALTLFNRKKPDLVLINITLAGAIDAIELTRKMNEINPIPFVYFTTQADTHALLRADNTLPPAYLLKPFEERSVQSSLELALDTFNTRTNVPPQVVEKPKAFANEIKLSTDTILNYDNTFFVKQNYRFVKLEKEDLVMVEAAHNYSCLYTIENRYIIRLSLGVILEKLKHESLIRIHRSFAVNIKHIKEFTEDEIKTSNGKTISITPAYRDEFLSYFNVL
jgi:two-component system, response regulator PdtaR